MYNNKKKPRNMFQKIRELTGNFSPRLGVLKNAQGTVLTEENDIKGRWKEYTQGLYERDPNATAWFDEVQYEQEPEPLLSEIRKALKDLTNRKSPGYDNIPIELFKAAGDVAAKMRTIICQRIWNTNTWPKDWKKSVFIPLPKKGDSRDCANNRTISLISHASKVLLKVIQRLEQHLDREIQIEQAGFQKG